jgi:hypothetical protein
VKTTLKHIQQCQGTVINDASQMFIVAGDNNSVIEAVMQQNNVYDQPNLNKCIQQTRTELDEKISTEQEAKQESTQTPTATTSTASAGMIGGAGGLVGGGAIVFIIVALIIYYLFFSSSPQYAPQ